VLRARRALGFTLIELLIGVTIVGVLLALGAPALGTYLQNSKISNAASMYYGAVQTARTEAIRRNVPVQFVLTNDSGTAAALATGAAPNPLGRNWIVRAASGATFEAVEAKSGAEGDGAAGGVQVAASGPAGFDGTIIFNGFGAMADSQTYTIDFTNPVAGSCAVPASGPMRCKRIVISPVGRIAACDPAAGIGDSRAC
jgi:type IV fimbrial biogenesis protein FimT